MASESLTWTNQRGAAFGNLPSDATVRDLVAALKGTYCNTLGIEYMHIGDLEKLDWHRSRVEEAQAPASREKYMEVYRQLARVDTFECFLNNKYKTTKRFGVDGGESAVVGLNMGIKLASELGVNECVIGMPHRGRLNVLTNVLNKPLTQIFAEFAGTHYEFDRVLGELDEKDWSSAGDVKYHLGTSQLVPLSNGKSREDDARGESVASGGLSTPLP